MTGGDRNDDSKRFHPVITNQLELITNDAMTGVTGDPGTLLTSKRKKSAPSETLKLNQR